MKLLFSTIKEISAENDIHDTVAVKMFFGDIERNYDTKLGYESKILALKSEIERLKSEIDKQNQELNALQKVLAFRKKIAGALGELIYFGFDDQEILNFAWALQSNISIKDSLENDLKKYGSLKKLIEGLDQESKKLEDQNKPVEAERD
jgi:predicted RNase H-like nuclease (RuvC/YqgF family)